MPLAVIMLPWLDDRLELWVVEVLGARDGNAEMLADVKAYDAAKARLESAEDDLIPLEITERRLSGEPALRIWREYRKLTQERLAKRAKVSRALIAAIETKRKAASVSTWKKLGAALDVSWEQLA